ncbi:MAG: hypothetical protein KAT58_06505 [candidate division Zixibacteria bacterium]|nr:hypothetical protein [candidate division Zixibacteria bacterium]
MPIELKNCRFSRTTEVEGFARFLLQTVPGSYQPDAELGCRSPYFAPEYYSDPKSEIRNYIIDQFQRYMGITVNVTISEQVESITSFFACRITGTASDGERFALRWEI